MTGGKPDRLMIWDAPNMDMCLSDVIQARATAQTRPRMDSVYHWLAERAGPGETVQACVFANVAQGHEGAIAPWVIALRKAGYRVYVKPKLRKDDDVDAAMLGYMHALVEAGGLREVVVASHDGRAFAEPLRRYAERGVKVTVLGYREKDVFGAETPSMEFVDIEDVPAAFDTRLPRTNLYELPEDGLWFEPFDEENDPRQSTAVAVAPVSTSVPLSIPAAADQPSRPANGLAAPGRPLGPVAPVPPVSAQAPTRVAGGPQLNPTRDQVIGFAVGQVTQSGSDGLGVSELGERLRSEYPDFDLNQSGFKGVGELITTMVDDHGVVVERRHDGSHVLQSTMPARAS